MSSQSNPVATVSTDVRVNDSKEIKEQQQSRKRKEPSSSSASSSIENENDRDSSKEPKMLAFEHDSNAWPLSSPHLSSSSSSSSASAASFGAESATYYQTTTSRKAAHDASKLHFQAERGPFPFIKDHLPLTRVTIVEWKKDGARMVDSIHRLKKDFYPIAYDVSKKEVLFQARQNEFYIRETEAGRKYKDWHHIQKHAKQVLEKNAADQQALKEKAFEQNGYSQELKNEADALLAEEVLMQSKVRLPQPERPKIIQEAITIMCDMRLPLGLYTCNDDDDDNDDEKETSLSSCSITINNDSSSSLSSSSSSSGSSSSSSASTSTFTSLPQIKPLRTYEIRLPTELIEDRMQYKVQVETWDKTIHHFEAKSGIRFKTHISARKSFFVPA